MPKKTCEQGMVIRRFKEEDKEGIRSIYKDFFEEVPTQFLNEEGFFVALLGNQVVGFVLAPYFEQSPYFDQFDQFGQPSSGRPGVKAYCFLEELHVYHKYYRKGIGTALTEKAIEYARSRNADAIHTMTDNFNVAAKKTYTKCGFKKHSGLTRYRMPLGPRQRRVANHRLG